MLLLMFALACSSDEVPAGDWANLDLAEVIGVVDGRWAHVEEGPWDFWVPVQGAEVGDFVLLGRGPAERKNVDGQLLDPLVSVDALELVDREQAALALAPPELDEDRDTIALLYAEREVRSGQPVRVGGRVVKSNHDIFGTNWYHLRDGTGAEGSDDLTFTSQAKLQAGDAVWVEAALTTDKNLGFGYRYDVILEGARVESLDGTVLAEADATRAPELGQSLPADPRSQVTPVLPSLSAATLARRTVYGLVLGETPAADLDAWAEDHQVRCTHTPTLARRTVAVTCDDDWLLVYPEGSEQVHHLSHTEVAGVERWNSRYAALVAQLGEPDRVSAPDNGLPSGPYAFRASWESDEVVTKLSLMRLSAEAKPRLRESWQIPGVEEALEDRGISVHGAKMPSMPENPHVIDVNEA